MLEGYLTMKENVLSAISMADFEKDVLHKRYQKIEQSESSFIRSKNVSVIENKLEQLDDLWWSALSNTTSFLISRFIEYKGYTSEEFKDYKAAKSIIKMADASLEQERFPEFRRHVFSVSALLHNVKSDLHKDFKGTGIG